MRTRIPMHNGRRKVRKRVRAGVLKSTMKGGRRDERQSKNNINCGEVRWGMPLILAHLFLLGCGQGIMDRGRGCRG